MYFNYIFNFLCISKINSLDIIKEDRYKIEAKYIKVEEKVG